MAQWQQPKSCFCLFYGVWLSELPRNGFKVRAPSTTLGSLYRSQNDIYQLRISKIRFLPSKKKKKPIANWHGVKVLRYAFLGWKGHHDKGQAGTGNDSAESNKINAQEEVS